MEADDAMCGGRIDVWSALVRVEEGGAACIDLDGGPGTCGLDSEVLAGLSNVEGAGGRTNWTGELELAGRIGWLD
jgi:hypothetical protein